MLKGEKVILRSIKTEDVPRQHEFNQDVELCLLDSDMPQVAPVTRAQAFFESLSSPNDDMASFAIEADGLYIGHCSLSHLRHRHGNMEVGITTGDRPYWGRRYGRDALTVLLHFGFYYRAARRIELTTHAQNMRAIRCYLACGFVEEGRPRKAVWIDGDYIDLVNMSILRDEWVARQPSVPAV